MKKSTKIANAQGSLQAAMRQGKGSRNGDAAKAGDLRDVMQQGKGKKAATPPKSLGRIMGQ